MDVQRHAPLARLAGEAPKMRGEPGRVCPPLPVGLYGRLETARDGPPGSLVNRRRPATQSSPTAARPRRRSRARAKGRKSSLLAQVVLGLGGAGAPSVAIWRNCDTLPSDSPRARVTRRGCGVAPRRLGVERTLLVRSHLAAEPKTSMSLLWAHETHLRSGLLEPPLARGRLGLHGMSARRQHGRADTLHPDNLRADNAKRSERDGDDHHEPHGRSFHRPSCCPSSTSFPAGARVIAAQPQQPPSRHPRNPDKRFALRGYHRAPPRLISPRARV